MKSASLRLIIPLLAGMAACTSHYPQPIVAVPEGRFRLEARNDSGQPPNPLTDRALNPDPYLPLNPGPNRPLNPDPAKALNPDPKTPLNPTYSPIPLPLGKPDSDRIVQFLEAGGDTHNIGGNTGAAPGAGRDYKGLLTQLADPSKPFTDSDLDKNGALRHWFDRVQTGGVVDARKESPPSYAPIAAHSGTYWWVFYTHGHNLAGFIVFKDAVPAPLPRSAQ
jgi:hypothetical protein